MNSNWRKPEEKGSDCILDIILKTNDLNDGVPCEICPHWFWRPCGACDMGTVAAINGDKLQHANCRVCNGTGHDGSGLGRCGLTRG